MPIPVNFGHRPWPILVHSRELADFDFALEQAIGLERGAKVELFGQIRREYEFDVVMTSAHRSIPTTCRAERLVVLVREFARPGLIGFAAGHCYGRPAAANSLAATFS